MKRLLLLALTVLASACAPHALTPSAVIQYPATWTPAPTPTKTPPGPTATLVIQHTPVPLATRDANARRLPEVPNTGIGLWIDTRGMDKNKQNLLVPRAQIMVGDPNTSIAHNPSQFLLLGLDAKTHATSRSVPGQFDGVLFENADNANPNTLAALRAQVAPRLLLQSVTIPQPAGDAVTSTVTISSNTDGLCYCNFLREADAVSTTFKSEAEWKSEVAVLQVLSSKPNVVILTGTPFPEGASKDLDSMRQWLNYALASFLMGINNSHTFFSLEGAGAEPFMEAPQLVAKIGTPLGAMFNANGIYQRRFTRGLVLVNPTASASRTFFVPHNFVDTGGKPVNQLALPPHSGTILLFGLF